MARGDLTVFEEFSKDLGNERHNFGTDTLKMGLITNAITPTANDATPTWGDYSSAQVSTAGGYTNGGITLASVTYTEAGGVATLDAANVSLSQNASGFTNAYWAIIYNYADLSGLNAICFIDLGGPVSEAAGPISVTFNAAGILTVTVNN